MSSLQASIVPLAKILRLNPHALYERQLALMRKGLLPPRTGRGPGSGTPFSAETVAVLVISMLATDSIKDSAEATRALCDARLESVPIGQEYELGNPPTFKAAMVNALSSDAMVSKITFLRVHRRSSLVEIFTKDDQAWEDPPAGKIFSRAELLLASDNDRLHLFEPKKKRTDTYEGMVVVVELRGGTLLGKGGGSPALGRIRALLRSDELAAAEASARKTGEHVAPAKTPTKKRSALKKG
jgi:hypothetical protein